MKKIRPRISEEEYEVIKGIRQASKEHGVSVHDVDHGWLKSKDTSVHFKNPAFKPKELIDFEQLSEKLLSDLQSHVPKWPQIKREVNNDGHLLVVDPADIHIGKLCSAFEVGEAYDNQIAVKRVLRGVRGVIDKARGYHIDKIVLVIGNDVLHIDSPKRTTTSGTPQDTDGMWHTNFLIAKQMYVDVIEILMSIADVHVTYNPSNHDYTHGFFLAQVIQTYFMASRNVTFDVSISHRKGFLYSQNLIVTTHGNGAKQSDLPLLMAQEFPIEWSKTKHRYIYVHHVHHKMSKDHIGVTVESLRSPSGTDSWHHRNGYQHAPKAVEGFIHSKEHGQVARFSHIF